MPSSDKATAGHPLSDALRQILRNNDDYIFIKDPDLVYLGCSESFARMTGRASAKELVGKTDFDLFPRDIAEKYRSDDRQVLDTGTPITGVVERLPDRDGHKCWAKTQKHVVFDPQGQPIALYGISRDITHLMGLETEAALSRKYTDLVRNMPGGTGIFHVENDAFVLDFINDGWAQAHHLSGTKAQALVGGSVMPLIYGPDRSSLLDEYRRTEQQDGSVGSVTYRTYGDDGKPHWISIQFRFAYFEAPNRYYYGSYTDMDEQKKAEEKLLDSQHALRETVANSDIQFFTYFPACHRAEIYFVNNRPAEMPTEWNDFPDSFLTFTQASDADKQAYRDMIAAIDSGEDEAECLVHFAYNGIYTWEHIHIKAVRDGDGHTLRAQGYSLNVTEKKTAEQRVQEERLRLKTLEGNTFEALSFRLSGNRQPSFRSRDAGLSDAPVGDTFRAQVFRAIPSLRQTDSETLDFLLRAASRIPEEKDRQLFLSACCDSGVRRLVSEGRYSTEILYRRAVDGMVRWVSTRTEVLPDPESGDLIAFFYTQDINDKVQMEKITDRIVRRNYKSVACWDLQSDRFFFKTGEDAVFLHRDGLPYLQSVEAGAAYVLPEEKASFLAKMAPDHIRAELEKNPVYTTYTTRVQRADGLPEEPPRKIKSDLFYLDEHRDTVVFLLTDVTEIFQQDQESKEQMADALAAARQASMAKSDFLSRMSHEIRTPLNAIIGMDTIAAQAIGNPERVADCISKIGISARYLLSLINDILNMSRIESGKMLLKNETFSFRDFISGINTMIYNQTRSKGLDYECTVSSEIAESYVGDAMKLQQILINILGNAVKFTPSGKVTFHVHPLSHAGNQSVVRFTVNDTGIGIHEDFMDRLFEPFEQSDTSTTSVFGGTGLGLAITKNLVNLMGGSIHVRSIVGVGSEFTVDVPLTVDESVLLHAKPDFHFEKMHTLIVDDDLVVCEQASHILRDIGMTGEWVTTGAEAVERVKDNCAKSVFYDFILVDWKMPDMDGIETTRKIRRIVGPDVTIIIITAYDWESIEADAKAAGANLLVSKPLLKTTLVSAFQKARGVSESQHAEEPVFDFTGKRILVAEDNQINAEIAKTLLESKNFHVEVAANGQKALELYAQNPARYYDAILMDIRMPLMDGLQTTTNIRHWNKEDARTIPIIAMTANAFDEDVDKSKAVGMNAHLSKPIDSTLLFSTLYRILFESDSF